MPDNKEKIKHIPKSQIPKAETITIELPVVDIKNGMRQEIAYLQYLMRKYSGVAKRFAQDMKLT